MNKLEISINFEIVYWPEEFEGKKKDDIKQAKELQKNGRLSSIQ